jgi:hypothetical protein
MIIEVNTKLLDVFPEINSNQLLFLSIVLDKNQPKYQDVRKIVSLISDDEIQYLVNQGLITSIERGNSITYVATSQLESSLSTDKSYFDLFYDMYPIYVLRPDGSKCYLRANVNKCRHLFNAKVGRSSAMAEHIIDCLKFEIDKKMREGKISYMMTMWNWLSRNQWEVSEEEMQDTEQLASQSYGTELI